MGGLCGNVNHGGYGRGFICRSGDASIACVDNRRLYPSIQQRHQFLKLPNMIAQPGLHRRGYAKRLVNPAVVVVHEVKRHHLGVILDLFGKRIS